MQDRVTDWHSLWTGRPAMNAWSALMYKVGLASGDWQKPVWFFADDVNNPSMAELWQAEGVANGGLSVLLHIDAVLPGQPYNKSRGFSQVIIPLSVLCSLFLFWVDNSCVCVLSYTVHVLLRQICSTRRS